MFLHCVVVTRFNVSEKHTASIFGVIEIVQVGVEVIQRKKCVGYVGQFEGV